MLHESLQTVTHLRQQETKTSCIQVCLQLLLIRYRTHPRHSHDKRGLAAIASNYIDT